MLIEFSVANFRSFKELQTLSMVAAKINSKDKDVDNNNVVSLNIVTKSNSKSKEAAKNADSKWNLLTTKAVYGANASGKSNLIKAVAVFLVMVRRSVAISDLMSLLVKPFLLEKENESKPSFFQLAFTMKNQEQQEVLYRYGFEIQNNTIITEWLFGSPKGVEVTYFIREDLDVEVNGVFKEAKKFENLAEKGDNEIFRKDSLFLSAVAAMGGEFAKKIVDKILSINLISSVNDPQLAEFVSEILLENEIDKKAQILSLLKAADFDIQEVEVNKDELNQEELPPELKTLLQTGKLKQHPKFISKRYLYDVNKEQIGIVQGDFDDWESEGTKKFFYLSPLLISALSKGRTLVIDEFDARLHPKLAQKIVQLFNSKNSNPNHAQLIFVTHDTSFLNQHFMRRDQICFVEKDKYGVSTLTTLDEYKGVRNDLSVEKSYLQGKYGAIPFLNEMDKVF
ncbi:MAG: AAA family ATPase [Bacteroidia bacterium]